MKYALLMLTGWSMGFVTNSLKRRQMDNTRLTQSKRNDYSNNPNGYDHVNPNYFYISKRSLEGGLSPSNDNNSRESTVIQRRNHNFQPNLNNPNRNNFNPGDRSYDRSSIDEGFLVDPHKFANSNFQQTGSQLSQGSGGNNFNPGDRSYDRSSVDEGFLVDPRKFANSNFQQTRRQPSQGSGGNNFSPSKRSYDRSSVDEGFLVDPRKFNTKPNEATTNFLRNQDGVNSDDTKFPSITNRFDDTSTTSGMRVKRDTSGFPQSTTDITNPTDISESKLPLSQLASELEKTPDTMTDQVNTNSELSNDSGNSLPAFQDSKDRIQDNVEETHISPDNMNDNFQPPAIKGDTKDSIDDQANSGSIDLNSLSVDCQPSKGEAKSDRDFMEGSSSPPSVDEGSPVTSPDLTGTQAGDDNDPVVFPDGMDTYNNDNFINPTEFDTVLEGNNDASDITDASDNINNPTDIDTTPEEVQNGRDDFISNISNDQYEIDTSSVETQASDDDYNNDAATTKENTKINNTPEEVPDSSDTDTIDTNPVEIPNVDYGSNSSGGQDMYSSDGDQDQ